MALPVFGSSTAVADGEYLGPGLDTTHAMEIKLQACENMNVIKMRVTPRTAGTGSGSIDYTLRVNGVDTSLKVNIDAGSTTVTTAEATVDIPLSTSNDLSVRVDYVGSVSAGHSLVSVQFW